MSRFEFFRRFVPLCFILVGIVVAIKSGLYHQLSFDYIKSHHELLVARVNSHWLQSIALYMVTYIFVTACSIPGATILTILGGLLFGVVMATILVVICATLGALILFRAVQSAIGQWIVPSAKSWVARLRSGFERSAMNYLLFLRLVPIFPFWIVNVAAGVTRVSPRVFATATFIGIIPGTCIYAWFGASLGKVVERHEAFSLSLLVETHILLPLLALGILALVPLGIQAWRRPKGDK